MYSIRMPSGRYLQGRFNLGFELNNQVFSNSDSSVLPGQFSFPTEAPLTPWNEVELDYPHLVTNAANWKKYEGVWVELYGVPMFYGTLSIRSANPKRVSFTIVANPLSALKQVPLNTLDLGGDRVFADEAAVLTHAKATALAPLDYDYVFFPVFNPDFIAHPDYSKPKSYYQNFYDPATGAFQVDHDYPALMPFARLEYVLQQIFSGQEFFFQNRFQIVDELRKICLYNNRSLWTSEGLDTTINLQNHVSETASTTVLRKVMSAFNLGLFTRIFSKTIDLVPLRDIVARPPAHDWTQYAVGEPETEGNEEQADYLCWKTDDADGAFEWYAKQVKPDPADVDGTINTSDLATIPDGIYYVEDQHAYFSVGARLKHLYTTLGCAPVESGKKKFEAEATAMWDAHLRWEAYVGTAPFDAGMRKMPHIRTQGTVSYEVPGDPDPETISTSNKVPDRLTIYRGMYDVWAGTDDYPLASGLPWDAKGNLIGAYSLRWDGQYGMYDTWWKTWHTMLIAGKHITQSFALPVADLVKFSFQDKIRVLNMDFLVKRLRVGTPLGRGLVLIEASLVSVI